MISQMKALEDENRRLKKMYAEMSMQAKLLKEALGVWAMFPASAQCAGPSVEPQTRLSHWLTGDCKAICREAHLLRTGVESAH